MNITRFNSICFTRKKTQFSLEKMFQKLFIVFKIFLILDLLTGNYDVIITLLKSQRLKNFKFLRFFENIFRKNSKFQIRCDIWVQKFKLWWATNFQITRFHADTVQRLLVVVTHVTRKYSSYHKVQSYSREVRHIVTHSGYVTELKLWRSESSSLEWESQSTW